MVSSWENITAKCCLRKKWKQLQSVLSAIGLQSCTRQTTFLFWKKIFWKKRKEKKKRKKSNFNIPHRYIEIATLVILVILLTFTKSDKKRHWHYHLEIHVTYNWLMYLHSHITEKVLLLYSKIYRWNGIVVHKQFSLKELIFFYSFLHLIIIIILF